jgi:GNAT superfamily N-acetyltransferase
MTQIGLAMPEDIRIIDITIENVLNYGLCGYKNIRREGYPEKIEWLKTRFSEGLKIKALYSQKAGTQGMIEYLPGEYCWRPVLARDYLFIHCLFVGFRKAYKGKGYGSMMLNECLKDARRENKYGVAVVTRQGAFMAGSEIFLKNGFKIVDSAPPDFELLVKKVKPDVPDPVFRGNWNEKLLSYKEGLTIIRADQCPYSRKNVREIIESAKSRFKITPKLVEYQTHLEAQGSPIPFGTFGIIFQGKVIAYHPISNTRFINIMHQLSR